MLPGYSAAGIHMSEETNKTANGDAAREATADSAEVIEPEVLEGKPDAGSELTRMRDQLLRTAADFDNFRKRARREQDEAKRGGQQQVLKDLLPVFDNLERAAQHADSANDAKTVADGVRMVLKQFDTTLDRMGIKRIPTVGLPFDPAVHEAIQHVESADHPAGVILHEVQGGYMMGNQLVRAAMVVVSKGPAQGDPVAS